MRYKNGLLAGLMALMMFSSVATAATRYVSDDLSINMRRGPGTGYRISELLSAGDRLSTLSESNGWMKVRTGDGKTGFVLTRFLSEQPAASTRIAAMKEQTEKFKTENEQLKKKLDEVRSGSEELTETKTSLVSENADLKKRLNSCAKPRPTRCASATKTKTFASNYCPCAATTSGCATRTPRCKAVATA